MKVFFYLSAIMLLGACGRPVQENKPEDTRTGASAQGAAAGSDSAATENRLDKRGVSAPGSVYHLIYKADTVPGRFDAGVIAGLSEPLRAMAAFYAAMGGTNCDGEYCKLTTALGLGVQGSEKHKSLINKFFPDDPVAIAVVAQDCYLRPSGASTFSDFEYLTFIRRGDTLKVDYSLMQYNRGKVTHTDGPDIYLMKDGTFRKLERNLWTHVERPQPGSGN